MDRKNHYKMSTYFYWFLIICLRLAFAIEYFLLNLFRWPILQLVKIHFLRRYQISLLFQDDEEQIFNDNNTSRPVVNLRVKSKNLMLKLITEGTLHFVEGILFNQIQTNSIEEITERVHHDVLLRYNYNPLFKLRDWIYLNASEFPWDDYDKSASNLKDWVSSDIKSIVYKLMDGELNCVSGFWDKDNLDLNGAIIQNMNKIGNKLNLKRGMKVLDLGCGTGIFANYLAKNYSVNVIGINFCKEEVERADKSNPQVQILHGDYRILLANKKYHDYFDRVVSIHLLEHLGGPKYHSDYFKSINQYLKPRVGKVFIQTTVFTKAMSPRVELSVRKYFVPRYVAAYTKEIIEEMAGANLTISNIESTGEHYERTANEYARLLKSISEDSFGKRVLEFQYGVGMLAFKIGLLDVWQIEGKKRSQRNP